VSTDGGAAVQTVLSTETLAQAGIVDIRGLLEMQPGRSEHRFQARAHSVACERDDELFAHLVLFENQL
jgi:hypothetical protein